MGDVVDLKPANLTDNHEFVADCCRYAEQILTEQQVRKKYHLFTDVIWEELGSDEALIEKIEAEKIRRIRDGSSKREKAQLLVIKAPDVVSKILLDDDANAKHRLDAAKVLNDFATPAQEAAAAGDRFVIQINLGADTLKFDRSIEINPNDVDPNEPGPAPQPLPGRNRTTKLIDADDVDRQEPLAAIPAKQPKKKDKNQSTRKIERTADEIDRSTLIWGE